MSEMEVEDQDDGYMEEVDERGEDDEEMQNVEIKDEDIYGEDEFTDDLTNNQNDDTKKDIEVCKDENTESISITTKVTDIKPPSISSSDDSDDNIGMLHEVSVQQNSIPVHSAKPTKTQRCLSSTSADTSETSGIGSLSEASALGDDHFETELGHSPTFKPSPGGSSSDDSVVEPMHNIEELDMEREHKGELRPEQPYVDHMKIHMQAKVDQLPLPEALKLYLMFYRK